MVFAVYTKAKYECDHISITSTLTQRKSFAELFFKVLARVQDGPRTDCSCSGVLN